MIYKYWIYMKYLKNNDNKSKLTWNEERTIRLNGRERERECDNVTFTQDMASQSKLRYVPSRLHPIFNRGGVRSASHDVTEFLI